MLGAQVLFGGGGGADAKVGGIIKRTGRLLE